MKMLGIMLVVSLFLTSCASLSPSPAPVDKSVKGLRTLQLSDQARKALGATNPKEIVLVVGTDGSLTLFGAKGQGFSVKEHKAMSMEKRDLGTVVNRVTITTVKNSPECNSIIWSGTEMWYPSPPCPIKE
jgi:hypothetical protein